MPLSLNESLIAAKNLLADSDAWILLAEVELDNTLRLADNTEDIAWDGETWTAFRFHLDVLSETSDGEVPRVAVAFQNVSELMQAEVEAVNGGVDSDITLYLVHTGDLAQTTVPNWTLAIKDCDIDDFWCTFTLGAINPFDRMFPPDRIRKTVCRHKYGDTYCGHSASTCDKTLTRCRVLSNSDAFGGFPGVGSGAIYA